MSPASDCHGCDICGRCEYELIALEAECVRSRAELAELNATLAEVRAQRDDWQEIAASYRNYLLSKGIGLSRISS